MTNLFNGTTHPLQISDLQEILKNRFLQSAINTFIWNTNTKTGWDFDFETDSMFVSWDL